MKKAIGVGLFLAGFVVALNFSLPVVAQAEKQAPVAASTTKDLLLEKVESAKALYKDGKLDEAERAFLAVRSEASASGVDLGKSVEKTIDKDLAAIQEQRLQMKKDALVARFKDAEGLYKDGKYDQAEKAFLEVKKDAESQGVDLGFWTTRSLNSYISKSRKEIEAAATKAEQAAKAAAEEKAKAASEGMKEQLLAKFKQGESLYREGKYLDARTILQEVSDAANTNAISFGSSTDKRLRKYLEDANAKIIEAAKKKEAERVADAQEKVKTDLLAKFADGEALYNEGKYAEAKTIFEKIRDTQTVQDVSLGYFKNRSVTSYISKCDSQIAKAAEEEAGKLAEQTAAQKAALEAQGAKAKAEKEASEKAVKEAEAKKLAESKAAEKAEQAKLKAEKETSEKAAREAEAKKLADKKAAEKAEQARLKAEKESSEKVAKEAEAKKVADKKAADAKAKEEAGNREELKRKLVDQFAQAEELYEDGKYAQAKPLFVDVKSVSEASSISLGFWTTRSLNGYLGKIDKKIAEAEAKEAKAQVAEKAPERPEEKPAEAPVMTEKETKVVEKAPEKETKVVEKAPEKAAKPEAAVDTEAARKARAQAAYTAGIAAYRSNELKTAQQYAYQALALMPEYVEASILLETVNQKLAAITQPKDPFEAKVEAERQARESEIRNYLSQARKAKMEKNYRLAEGFAAQAKVTAEANVQYGFENYIREANDLLQQIAPEVAQEKAEADRRKEDEAAKLLKEQQDATAGRVELDVNALMARANDHIKLEDYAAAAADLEAVLKLKPDYAYASVLGELVEQWAAQKVQRDAETARLGSIRKLNADISEKMVFAISPEFQYPPHWKEQTGGRGIYMGTPTSQPLEESIYRQRKLQMPTGSLAAQEVEKKLQKPIPYFDFTGQPFMAMVELLRTTGGFNIVVDPLVTPGPEQTITLQLTDATIKTILDLVTQQVGLKWTVRENYLYISDEAGIARLSVTGTQLVIIYDVRDLIVPIQDYTSTGIGRGAGGAGGGARGGGGGGRGGGGGGGGGGGSGGGRFFGGGPFGEGGGTGGGGGAAGGRAGGAARGGGGGQNVNPDQAGFDLATLIMQTVDRTVWNVPPEMYVVTYSIGGRLIVYAQPEVQQHVVDFLTQLREIRAISVLIEARTITVTDAWLSAFQAEYPLLDLVAQDYTGPFTSLSASLGASGELPQGVVTGISTDFAFGGTTPVAGTVATGFRFGFDYLDGIELQAVFRAIEKSQNTQTLDMPRLMLANGQMGYLQSTRTFDYISEINANVAESAVGYTVTRGTMSVGTAIQIRPVVSYDRKYVQLDVLPDINSLVSITPYVFPSSSGDITQQLITTSEISLRSTVSIPDGGTAFLGGQSRASEILVERGVPIISKIPLIGNLFKTKVIIKDKGTTLFLITPHIIIRDEYEARL